MITTYFVQYVPCPHERRHQSLKTEPRIKRVLHSFQSTHVWKWPVIKCKHIKIKPRICVLFILCLTWTVNANSLKQNIVVIKEICSSQLPPQLDEQHLQFLQATFCSQKGGSQSDFSSGRFWQIFCKVRISHIFLHKLVFSMAILIFVFLLPISVRFHYLDHLPTECHHVLNEIDQLVSSNFVPYFCIFLPHIWHLCDQHVFSKNAT